MDINYYKARNKYSQDRRVFLNSTQRYPSIPDSTGRHHKGSMADTRRSNHDEVQTVVAAKLFRRKRVAVYLLHTLVIGVSKHQTIIQSKIPTAFGQFFQLQFLKKGIYLTK
jgi:hypothetical protein